MASAVASPPPSLATSSPSFQKRIAGSPITLLAIATLLFPLTLTLVNLTLPSNSLSRASTCGINALQGPHWGPQKSTSTEDHFLLLLHQRFLLSALSSDSPP